MLPLSVRFLLSHSPDDKQRLHFYLMQMLSSPSMFLRFLLTLITQLKYMNVEKYLIAEHDIKPLGIRVNTLKIILVIYCTHSCLNVELYYDFKGFVATPYLLNSDSVMALAIATLNINYQLLLLFLKYP